MALRRHSCAGRAFAVYDARGEQGGRGGQGKRAELPRLRQDAVHEVLGTALPLLPLQCRPGAAQA